ncbi:MAG: DUF1344 domain-containing protein [Candidatus Rokubacteria bacterium]|nr:DUF1344 domain-containing protein [Candidatus Rokubacteria bacterium]MBI3105882.1 DUF1344 domain-containing protein [Candidatus Rokubacteria bacterium]
MWRRWSVTALGLVAALVLVSAPAWAADIEGKIKSVDPAGRLVTLEDGTQLVIPATLKVARQELKPGASVKATFQDQGGQKMVTAIQVQAAKDSMKPGTEQAPSRQMPPAGKEAEPKR